MVHLVLSNVGNFEVRTRLSNQMTGEKSEPDVRLKKNFNCKFIFVCTINFMPSGMEANFYQEAPWKREARSILSYSEFNN